jgi:FkbM family methyltransferase
MPFGPFGMLALPYHKMGAIDSIDLFGLDELIIFSFYWANRGAYKRAVDIGANLGLHTILMSRSGYEVTAFEPDPVHFRLLKQNLAYNRAERITPIEAAVSDHRGKTEFVRVKGNTTGSHISGAKANPYGELDRFSVDLVPFEEAVRTADLVKVDAEGHEVVILRSLPPERWNSLDAIVEVGTPENAAALLEHFKPLPVRLFSQKTGWSLVRDYAHLPTSHREGSLFITAKPEMPWAD